MRVFLFSGVLRGEGMALTIVALLGVSIKYRERYTGYPKGDGAGQESGASGVILEDGCKSEVFEVGCRAEMQRRGLVVPVAKRAVATPSPSNRQSSLGLAPSGETLHFGVPWFDVC